MQTINVSEIKEKLFNKLVGTGWDIPLRLFVRSTEFENIILKLYEDRSNDYRFTPTLNDIFKPFEYCHHQEMRVVFMVPEPLSQIGFADGLCLSAKRTMKKSFEHVSQFIFKELETTIKLKTKPKKDPNLKRWAEQGILMLNCTLTTTLNEKGRHVEIWKPFMNYLIDMMSSDSRKLIYVFFGDAKEWSSKVNENAYKIFVSNPMDAGKCHKKNSWDSQDIFNKINLILKENGKNKINW